MDNETLGTEVLGSGCVRQVTGGRGQYELLSPFVIERDAKLAEWGSTNRGDRNWEKGCPFSRCVQSMFRHMVKYMQRDPDAEMDDNLAAIRFWAGALMHYEEMIKRGLLPKSLDDMPTYQELKAKAEELMTSPKPNGAWKDQMRIYVAGPISNDNPHLEAGNYTKAQNLARELEAKGHLVFCPHDYVVDTDEKHYEYLLALDFSIIRNWATALYFIAPSPGANRELKLAEELELWIFRGIDEVPVYESPNK